jgi:hypothetical protein
MIDEIVKNLKDFDEAKFPKIDNVRMEDIIKDLFK